jgi:mRNA interferase RelE/StbE
LAWRIEVADPARKELAKLGAMDAQRIVRFLRDRVATADDPRTLGKALKGSRFEGAWRYRVGDHRVLVDIQDQWVTVLVVAVAHRKDVYR